MATCEEQFNFFQRTMEELMDTYFPYKSVTRHTADKPWVTDYFRHLIRQRQRAIMSGDIDEARRMRNLVNRTAPKLRQRFYQSKIAALEDTSSNDWWKHMKNLTGASSSNTNEMQGLANKCTGGDMTLLVNSMNDFFVSVSADLPRLDPTHRVFDIEEPLPAEFTIEAGSTQRALQKVKCRKATGPDNIPPWMVNNYAHLLAAPVTAIFNSSLREGKLPDLWKTATVIPVPKKHPPGSLENDIRPISLTPILAKAFEGIVLNWVDDVITPQIDERQFGGLAGTGTTDALVEMFHSWCEATDKPDSFVRVLLVDYSKAFDHINHELLITKLCDMGLPPHLVRWMAAFLIDRQQSVKIGDTVSNIGYPNGGVPQGTLSGPKNFLVQINDLQTPCPIFKYVDDSTVFDVCNNTSVPMLQESADATDKPDSFVRVLLVDYSKAFDHINHELLITKLCDMGLPPHLVRWMAAFLIDRQQSVKIGDTVSNIGYPNGGVPQGTLSGPKNFLVQINDLQTPCPIFKYVDDSTVFDVCNNTSVPMLQESADVITDWSRRNDMRINARKTKEMIICFCRNDNHVASIPRIVLDDNDIERVTQAKVLGVTLSSDLSWNAHVDTIVSKARKRVFTIYQLKRAGIRQCDLLRVYVSVIRPVLEYACPVWHTSLPMYLSDHIETIQKRCLRTIFPGYSYDEARSISNLPTLFERRTKLCQSYFRKMQNADHKLHKLLPKQRSIPYGLRTYNTLPVPLARTDRFRRSLIPWGLANWQHNVL